MSLSLETVDRLFDRLAATYGRQWFVMWEGVDASAVKSLWAHELDAFSNSLKRIAWALENLPNRCPNAVEFKALCRQAPAPDVERLPAPQADPERVKAELAKLAPVRKAASAGIHDGRAWARTILTKHRGGLRVNPTTLQFAKEALRLTADGEAA